MIGRKLFERSQKKITEKEKKLLMKVQRAEQQLESLRCLQDIHQLFNMLTVETEIQNITLIC